MRHAALACLLFLSACSKCGKETPAAAPVVDAGAPVVAAPPAAKSLTALSTLSLLEPSGDRCEWRQLDPVTGDRVVLASFPGTCVGARVSWSPDASRAVVWFDPTHVQAAGIGSDTIKPGYPEEAMDQKAQPRAYALTVLRPEVEPIPFPSMPDHSLQEFGVDATGAVIAFLEEKISEEAQRAGKVTAGGQTFDLTTISEGLPVVVHAYRLEGKNWRRSETKLSTTGWDYALGVKELGTFQKTGPRSLDLSAPHAQGDVPEGEEAAALAKVTPKNLSADDGEWIFLGAGGTRFYAWEFKGEFAYTTGLIVANGKPLPNVGFTEGDTTAIRTSGPFVLVTAANVGAHPRLYQLPEGKLVFSSDTARAVTFWPTTAKAESHEHP